MRADFMALIDDISNQLGKSVRNPSQDKESGLGIKLRENLEDGMCVPFDSRLEIPPIFIGDKRVEV